MGVMAKVSAKSSGDVQITMGSSQILDIKDKRDLDYDVSQSTLDEKHELSGNILAAQVMVRDACMKFTTSYYIKHAECEGRGVRLKFDSIWADDPWSRKMNVIGYGTYMHIVNNTLAIVYMLLACMQQPRNSRLWGQTDGTVLDWIAEPIFWLITAWFWFLFFIQLKCIYGKKEHWSTKVKHDVNASYFSMYWPSEHKWIIGMGVALFIGTTTEFINYWDWGLSNSNVIQYDKHTLYGHVHSGLAVWCRVGTESPVQTCEAFCGISIRLLGATSSFIQVVRAVVLSFQLFTFSLRFGGPLYFSSCLFSLTTT
jgi:hypothetical protein